MKYIENNQLLEFLIVGFNFSPGQLIDMAKCYHAEVEWRDMKYVPATEHLEVSARTSGCMHVTNQGFILMGDVATTEAIEWTYTYPKIIKAVCIIARLNNDIMSYKVS